MQHLEHTARNKAELDAIQERYAEYVSTHYCGLTEKSVRRYFLDNFIHLSRAWSTLADLDTFRLYKLFYFTHTLNGDLEESMCYGFLLMELIERINGTDFYSWPVRKAWRAAKGLIQLPFNTDYDHEDYEIQRVEIRQIVSDTTTYRS